MADIFTDDVLPEVPLTFQNFVPEVRGYVRDFPELNRIIHGEESSNRLIEYCVRLAIDEYNTTPPLTRFPLQQFPSRTILLQLTLLYLLQSVGILHSRNRIAYNDGGFSVETEQQDTLYQNWINLIRSQVMPRLQRLKVAINIESGWGAGVGSEYGWIHGWYGLS
jgi:hypothetical protein